MTITNAMKLETSLRVSNGNRWLVWDSTPVGMWVVYERKAYAKKTTTLIKTTNEELAVKKLLED